MEEIIIDLVVDDIVTTSSAPLVNDEDEEKEEEWVELKYSYLGICPYCGEKIVGATHRDHVVPISRGGSNSIDNIVPCCAPCNYKKNDRPLIVFMAGGLS